jgi:thioredoxin 1
MMKKEEPSAMMEKGSYESYSADKLARADKGDVVLFFKASWCPSCKAVDADIKANLASIPKGLSILEVNYDTATELKTKYGVTYQHTFVQVDSKGAQIAKWSGSPTLAALTTKVQ